MRRTIVLPLLAALGAGLCSSAVRGAEGMWQPRQLPAIAERLAGAGYAGDSAAIADLDRYPMNAVVAIAGCSASFVSPQGLIATNHHCAYGTIQYNSTGERNLLDEGFLAADFSEELAGDPNQRVWVTDRIVDVTDQMQRAIRGAGSDDRAVWDAFETRVKALVKRCEAEGPYRCEVYSFLGGAEFNLIRQIEIKDVRLVYAPAESIGKFGGDVDNWMWPRHTGDFAFLRAYVGTDGKPAPYSRDNVPYRPRSHLRVAADGVGAGDFVMVAGYPGRTNRWRMAEELDDAIGWSMPTGVSEYGGLIRVIETATAERPDAALRYASTLAALNNNVKNLQGQLEGFRRAAGVAAKREHEAAFTRWLAQGGNAEAQTALSELREALDDARAVREGEFRFGLIVPANTAGAPRFNREGSPIAAALDLYRLSIERRRPDHEREPGFQVRDEPRIRARLQMFDRRYDATTDRALLEHRLRRYATLPAAQRVPELDAWMGIGGDQPDLSGLPAVLDAFYAGFTLDDAAVRLAWFGAPQARIERAPDSALKLGRVLYPDANNSLRVTYGNVVGFSPRDAVEYAPFTTLAGLAAKATGVRPFDAPTAQLEAIAEGRGAARRADFLRDVPVNFLADLDITGGNSGSPTLNARGELVGLVFDGNWESVSSNWVFDPALTRSIHVDVRYMLWVMEEVDHAQHLVREMGVTPRGG